MIGVSNANLQVSERLSKKGRRRIVNQARYDKIKQRYLKRRDALKEAYDRQIGRVEAGIVKDDAAIWQVIDQHRDQLTPNGERSFTTRWVRFQFKQVAASVKVKDADGILSTARKRRVLRQFGRQVWVLDNAKFLDYLKQHPEQYKHYQAFLEETPEHETLSIKLNEGHDVFFDNTQLTAKAVPVKRSSPR